MPVEKKDQRLDKYMQKPDSPIATGFISPSPLDYSVDSYIPKGKINYANLDDTAKIVRAVVSLSKANKGAFSNIQEAIQFVHNTYGQGVVFIKKGTYSINYDITFFDNIYLLGEDNVTTILGFLAGQNQINITGVSNVGIERIAVQNGRNTKGVIYCTNSNTITLRKIAFTSNTAVDGSGTDIYLDNAGGAVDIIEVSFNTSTNDGSFVKAVGNGIQSWFIENDIVSPLQYCFYGDPTTGAQGYFLNNYFQDIVTSGLYGRFINSNFISNRSFFTSQTSTQYQVDFLANTNEIIFNSNYFKGGGHGGIRITSGNTITINGSRFNGNGTIGMNLGSVTEAQITGCQILSGNSIPVSLGTSGTVTFTGCEIIAPNTAGVDAIDVVAGTSNVFTGNYIQAGGSAYAVNLDTNTKNCAVVGNRLNAGTATLNNGGTTNIIASNA